MVAFTFRNIHPSETSQAIALMQSVSLYDMPSEEERAALHAQLKRSFSSPHSSTHNIACLDATGLLGIAIYFINHSILRDEKGLYIEDLYTPPHWPHVTEALLKQLASIALSTQCNYLEWSTLDHPIDRLASRLSHLESCCSSGSSLTYRLSGESLLALASH